MNCEKCKEQLVGYAEGLLTESQKQILASHLKECPSCRAELAELTNLRKRITANGKAFRQIDLEDTILNRIVQQQSIKLRKSSKQDKQIQLWRKIMSMKITKLTAAAVIIIGIFWGLTFIGGPDMASIAFADVLEHIHSLSYTFDLTTVTSKQASDTVQAMVLEPGRMRMDVTVGLGKTSSVLDTAEGKSMILFHQFKVAQVHDMTSMVEDYGVEGILFLCTKSIENLWDMRDGTEEELGEKEIEGQTAVGFKVFQEDQYIRSETTIWAHAKTAAPILVEMIILPLEDSQEQMKFIMNNFKLDVELDEELFSVAVPPGYTLAYQLDLDELEKKTE